MALLSMGKTTPTFIPRKLTLTSVAWLVGVSSHKERSGHMPGTQVWSLVRERARGS